MLSNTWKDQHLDERLRTNLFHGLAQVMLTLAVFLYPRLDLSLLMIPVSCN